MEPKLLTRDQFREGVFSRDKHTCVVPGCNKPACDAHHILERRLWGESGGYFLENGASVCEEHHLACERTIISVEDIREYAGITRKVIPDHLYESSIYDKWGNEILPNGQRLRGELFDDESVQKVLKEGGALELFTQYVKAPRTLHLDRSPGIHDDDRVMKDTKHFENKEVIGFLKLDGENTTFYNDHIHARSVDSPNHESRTWVKTLHGLIAHNIPPLWRIQGENMYAKHSIYYDFLDSYFYGFGVWNEKNVRLPWDECVEWFNILNIDLEGTGYKIEPCPYFYRGIWNPDAIQKAWDDFEMAELFEGQEHEGYVVHLAEGFHYRDYRKSVAKWVRKDHVKPHALFWKKNWIPNSLSSK